MNYSTEVKQKLILTIGYLQSIQKRTFPVKRNGHLKRL